MQKPPQKPAVAADDDMLEADINADVPRERENHVWLQGEQNGTWLA